jgi:hypothetical protein
MIVLCTSCGRRWELPLETIPLKQLYKCWYYQHRLFLLREDMIHDFSRNDRGNPPRRLGAVGL